MDFPYDNVSKPYNKLKLADRVEVIRTYNKAPHITKLTFKSLAAIFGCSVGQIKNILDSQKDILKKYAECGNDTVDRASRKEATQKRQGKIDFLAKVLHEYIKRVVYYNYSVDEEKVRQKALQIKECIVIENFQLNNGWFEDFKMTHGISAFDSETLRNNIQVTEKKKPNLSPIELIQYVAEEEQKSRKSGIKRKLERLTRLEKLHTALEPKCVYDRNDDNYSTDERNRNISADYNHGKKHSILNTILTATTYQDQILREFNKPKTERIEMYSQQPAQKPKREDSPIPDIQMAERAVKYVKALEEYAMLQDDYRAIGLLTQLEQIIEMHSQQQPVQKPKHEDSPIPDIETAEKAVKYVKALEEYAKLQDDYRAIGLLTQLEQIFQKKCKLSIKS